MLGKLLTRDQARDERTRAITEFAMIDGVAVDGSGLSALNIYRGAMSIPGAWRSVLILADLLGRVPWEAYRRRGGRPVEKLEPTPMLLEQPAPPDTRMTTISSWAMDLIWHGNSVGIIAARNADGVPTGAHPVPAEQVGVRRVTNAAYSPLPVGAIEYDVGGEKFGADDVIHVKGPCKPGALRGLGVLEAHIETLELADEQQAQSRNLAEHGVPTALLKVLNPDATTQDLRDAKAAWVAEQRQGRRVQAINAGIEFQALSWKPEEMQMIEGRKFTREDIALIFGLPFSFLGVETSNRTYRNDNAEDVKLVKWSAGGHLARFEQTLSNLYPRGTTVKADLDEVVRPDLLTRYQAHQLGLQNKFLTRDEVRDMEDRPPLDDDQVDELNEGDGDD